MHRANFSRLQLSGFVGLFLPYKLEQTEKSKEPGGKLLAEQRRYPMQNRHVGILTADWGQMAEYNSCSG